MTPRRVSSAIVDFQRFVANGKRGILRWRLTLVALAAILGLALSARSRVRINWTDSLPRGLYLVAAVPRNGVVRGQIVVACPPRSYAEIGRDHGYLISGGCPGGVAPVLKLVAARAGDIVQLSSAGIEVNGSRLPGTTLLAVDNHSDPPAHVAFGIYRVPVGEIWLFTSKPDGYDSRYFGPVPISNVLNIARPLLTSA